MDETARWHAVRRLFDAVCDKSPGEWEPALQAQCPNDPALVDETLHLLRAQTAMLGRIRHSLDSALVAMGDAPAGVGDQIGPWRLSRLLGSGGMGTVFLAERADALYRREVAIKLLRPALAGRHAADLGRESQILADLQHPHIARLYDVGSDRDGSPFVVMEYVDGIPLDRACRERRLGLRARLRLFATVCRAVQFAHARLVVHCDLKPANVLVRPDGQPVLLDFGIARLLDQERSGDSGPYLTPAYASPEAAEGRAATVAGDVFGLGVLLAELLSGAPSRRTVEDAGAAVPPPSTAAAATLPWRRALRGDLDAIVAKACAALPDGRYASAQALAEDIERYLAHRAVRARRTGRLHRLRLFARRRWRESLVAATVLALAGGFGLSLHQARRTAEETARAATDTAEFLIAAFEATDPDRRGGAPLSAHEILDMGARRLQSAFPGSPLLKARLQTALGRAYQNLGRPAEAGPLLQAAIAGLGRARAPAVEQATAATTLSELLNRQSQHAQALHWADRALALLEAADRAADRADALTARARARAGMADYAAAHRDFLESIRISRVSSTSASRRTLTRTLIALGDMHRAQGELDASRKVLDEALKTAALQPHGEHGLDFQRGLNALSRTLLAQGHVDPALALAQRGLVLTHEMYGEESSHTAAAEAALAGQYLDLGRYADSERHFGNALRISLQADGPDSIPYAGHLYASGVLEEARGDIERAEAFYRQALAIRRARLGSEHRDSLDLELGLARLLLRTGRTGDAHGMLARVERARGRELPDTAPGVLALRLIRIEWMIRSGRHPQAEVALDHFEAEHPALAPWLALRLQMQRALQAQATGSAQSAPRWRRVVDSFSTMYGADSTATAKWRIPLAESLAAHGQAGPAVSELERACPQLAPLAANADLRARWHALARRLDATVCEELAPAAS